MRLKKTSSGKFHCHNGSHLVYFPIVRNIDLAERRTAVPENTTCTYAHNSTSSREHHTHLRPPLTSAREHHMHLRIPLTSARDHHMQLRIPLNPHLLPPSKPYSGKGGWKREDPGYLTRHFAPISASYTMNVGSIQTSREERLYPTSPFIL